MGMAGSEWMVATVTRESRVDSQPPLTAGSDW
jgi:hypothetical protein